MAAPMFTFFGRIIRPQITAKCNCRCKFLVLNLGVSGFHTGVPSHGRSLGRTARRLELLFSKRKALNRIDQLEVVRPPILTPGTKGKRIPPHASIRLKTYNTIVHECLRDVITSNAISEELQDMQVEIVAVRYTGDMSTCRVFWKATGTAEQDSRIQSALNKYAPNIRHYLISQRILGKIPQLCFLTDRAAANAAEVERLLAIADFGPAEDVEGGPAEDLEGEELSTLKNGEGEDKEIIDQTKDSVLDIEEMNNLDSNESLFGIDHSFLQKKIQSHKKLMEMEQTELDQSEGSGVDDLSKNFKQFYKDMKRHKKKSKSTLRREERMYKGELDDMAEVAEMNPHEREVVWNENDDASNLEEESEFLEDDNYDGYEEDDEYETQSHDESDPHGKDGKS